MTQVNNQGSFNEKIFSDKMHFPCNMIINFRIFHFILEGEVFSGKSINIYFLYTLSYNNSSTS